jgi:hypothetical protein
MVNDECGAVTGMRTGRGNRSTRRKTAAVPLCPSEISPGLEPGATGVGSRWLTTWAMARPSYTLLDIILYSCSRHLRFFSFLIISNTDGPVLLLLFLKPRIESNFLTKQSFTRGTLCKNFQVSFPPPPSWIAGTISPLKKSFHKKFHTLYV